MHSNTTQHNTTHNTSTYMHRICKGILVAVTPQREMHNNEHRYLDYLEIRNESANGFTICSSENKSKWHTFWQITEQALLNIMRNWEFLPAMLESFYVNYCFFFFISSSSWAEKFKVKCRKQCTKPWLLIKGMRATQTQMQRWYEPPDHMSLCIFELSEVKTFIVWKFAAVYTHTLHYTNSIKDIQTERTAWEIEIQTNINAYFAVTYGFSIKIYLASEDDNVKCIIFAVENFPPNNLLHLLWNSRLAEHANDQNNSKNILFKLNNIYSKRTYSKNDFSSVWAVFPNQNQIVRLIPIKMYWNQIGRNI